ncbi:MAG: hypothetical protein ABJ327_03600, partial [Litoreibacter sp.]
MQNVSFEAGSPFSDMPILVVEQDPSKNVSSPVQDMRSGAGIAAPYAHGIAAKSTHFNMLITGEAPKDGWKTYNFEVEEHHTYVAEGIRVHNMSGILGQFANYVDENFFDATGSDFLDQLGDVLTFPLHVVGKILVAVQDVVLTGLEAVGDALEGPVSAVGGFLDNLFGFDPDFVPAEGTDLDGNGRTDGPRINSMPKIDPVTGLREAVRTDSDGSVHDGDYSLDFDSLSPAAQDFFDANAEDRKPVIIDLDGDGIEVSTTSTVSFDLDEDGYKENSSWAAADDGFLVIDLEANGTFGNGDGKIDQARELAFALWGMDGATDLQALAQAKDGNGNRIFDTNGDGRLTSADTHWSSFKIWQDLDQDGITDTGELKTLSQWGITQINLTYDDGTNYSQTTDDIEVFGNTLSGLASYTRNGEVVVGGVGDVSLSYNPLGYRIIETAYGQQIEFEGNTDLNYAILDETASSSFLDPFYVGDFDGVTGHDGNDFIIAVSGVDKSLQIAGGAGDDWIIGGDGDDFLSGGEGLDVLSGGGGDDVLFVDHQDRFGYYAGTYGGEGNDRAIFITDEDVTLNLWETSIEAVDGGGGDDTFTALNGTVSVEINGLDGNDTLIGSNVGDFLAGDDGDDRLEGKDGNDLLFGGAGNDKIYGGDGDDFLTAGDGTGTQNLYGQNGNDTYLYNNGDGRVWVSRNGESANTGSNDRFIFASLYVVDVEFEILANHGDGSQGDVLKISWDKDGQSGDVYFADLGTHIERFEFADGSSFDQIVFDGDTYSSAGALEIKGSGLTDDLLHSPNDASETYYLKGYDGDDTLIATTDGGGDNYLAGNAGSDDYIYYASAGNTWVSRWGENAEYEGTDVFRFADLNVADLTFTQILDYNDSAGDVLEISFNDGSAHHVRFADMGEGIERFEFADGSSFSSISVTADGRVEFKGTGTTDDVIFSPDTTNGETYYLKGYDGDDTLIATTDGGGDNYLAGNAGSDDYIYHASAGN